ncbi:hypothetical protein PFNF135_02416 [Plasmodium falciparum NF135/5.C10]|uniref:Surface antigen n=1 Tax=Plasmodium falciparum NF135/5.C10 TaxID=1036726 RepID=W4IGY7_PLAFA|nr:hypothetical protein PFNF135_02416 [Plasmodium falciparum NF135/5.C10]
MKVHYINILLFAVPLNILVYNQRNHKSTTHHTPKVPTTRLLCECDLYNQNYDNDPEMKRVMQQFDDRTSQRFHEYDKRMIEKQQKCKEQCEKDIQKIILKDKLEKELMDKFATLQTDIQNDAIPTCVCEKSLADKTEKFCHNCGYGLGSIAPNIGLLGGPGIYGWKIAVFASVKEFAAKYGAAKGAAAGLEAGKNSVIEGLKALNVHGLYPDLFESIGTKIHYTNAEEIAKIIVAKYKETCNLSTGTSSTDAMCKQFDYTFGMRILIGSHDKYGLPASQAIPKKVGEVVAGAEQAAAKAAKDASESVTAEITSEQTTLIEAGFNSSTTSIYASIIVINMIVLIMVIIYLILRYRRKKKMKKKLLYIKLLEE